MTRKEDKVGNYFRIKGPVDLFLFFSDFSETSTFTLCLRFLVSTHLYPPSKLSQFCTFSLPFDSPTTRSFSVLFSAQPHFLKSLLSGYFSGCAPP